MTGVNHDPGETNPREIPARWRSRRRFSLPLLMVAGTVAAVAAWMWVCLFAGLDDEETAACVFLGFLLGLPALGLFAFVAVAVKACPSDPLPRDSATIERPQFTIGCLMTATAIAAVGLALIMSSRS